jgi:N-ethylmaleimide reductase
MTALYYAQRASAGLIISEGLYPEPMGKGYVRTPGLADDRHVAAWRAVTDAVHAAGGRIVAQLMHAGRISDPGFLPDGATPVAPSAVRAPGSSYTDDGLLPHPTPRALETHEIQNVISEYAAASRRALRAGFDGVELHAGTGYLPMQFLSSGTNQRRDRYGGDVRGRTRFVLEVLEAVAAVAGPARVGLKITPEMPLNDAHDDDPISTYAYLVRAANALDLAFLDVAAYGKVDYHRLLRPLFSGAYLRGVDLTPASASVLVEEGAADGAVFGKAFIANPDLPDRIRRGLALADADPSTFYSPGPNGYVDYPAVDRRTEATHAAPVSG